MVFVIIPSSHILPPSFLLIAYILLTNVIPLLLLPELPDTLLQYHNRRGPDQFHTIRLYSFHASHRSFSVYTTCFFPAVARQILLVGNVKYFYTHLEEKRTLFCPASLYFGFRSILFYFFLFKKKPSCQKRLLINNFLCSRILSGILSPLYMPGSSCSSFPALF